METTNKRETFTEIINGNTLVLVDFFASDDVGIPGRAIPSCSKN